MEKFLHCFPLQLYMGIVLKEKTQMHSFLFKSGLSKIEHTQLTFGINNKMINCAMLGGSSFLRGQDVAHHNQWKDEHFLGVPLLR